MDDIAVTSSSDLYEKDFYAWTQAQSALLRIGRLDEADITNILEEIESLGRTQVSELHSRLRVLALHLLKEIYQPEKASRSWASTIIVQRQDLNRHIRDNPSLKPKTSKIFAEAYTEARKIAATETGISLKTFPIEAPFTYTQAMDEAFWPARSLEDRA